MTNPHDEGIKAAASKLMSECDVLQCEDEHRHAFKCDDLEELTEAIIEAYLKAAICVTAENIIEEFKDNGVTKH